jgi:hypothetical protein
MLALGVVAVFRLWRGARRAKDLVAAAPLLAFLMFTLLNAAVCCDRRLGLGMSQSVTSRYSSLTMLWLLALYALWAKFALTEPRPATLLACASLAVLMMTGTIANAVEWRYDHPEWFRSFALRTYAIRYAGVVSDEALLSVYWHPDLIRERSPFMRADGYSLFHREVPMGVPAKYNGSGGGCQIDSVNGRTGEVIDAHLQGDSSGLRVVGWAVDDAARHEPSRVFVSIDGQIDVPALTGGDLPDDVRFLRNSSYGQFGFISYMRTSLLTVGEHALELKIVSQDGSGYRTCGAARLRVTD